MKNNTLVYVVGGVVVLAAVLWLATKGGVSNPYGSPTPSPTKTASPSTSGTPRPTVAPTAAPSNSPTAQSYNDALVTYANRRIQFDAGCQASPARVSIAKGTSIMLDNRSGDARTFAVGGVGFTLPGFGWRIVTPVSAQYPADVHVDCGSARNVATVVVQ